MKRIVALFLALLLIVVSLMACDKELTPDTLPTRYTPGDGSYRYFADNDAQAALSLQLPSSWSVLRRNGSIFLTQDGVIIGSVSKAEIDDEEKKKLTLCHGDDTAEGEAVLAYYGKAMLSEEMQQCYVFRYLLNGSTFVFRIAAAQMDKTSYAWLCAPAPQDIFRAPTVPLLAKPVKTTKAAVLIGSSTLYDIKVNSVFNAMANEYYELNGPCGLVTYGGAKTVKDVLDPKSNYRKSYDMLLKDIQAWEYFMVVISGIQTQEDVDAAIKLNKTYNPHARLVVLQLPDDNEECVQAALDALPQAAHLNLAAMIDGYVDAGIPRSDFIDEDTGKLTALSGYLIARMMYYGVFRTKPVISVDEKLTAAYIREKLDEVEPLPRRVIAEEAITRVTQ